MKRLWVVVMALCLCMVSAMATAGESQVKTDATVLAHVTSELKRVSAGIPLSEVTASGGETLGFRTQTARWGDTDQPSAMGQGYCEATAEVEYYDKNGSAHVMNIWCVGDDPPKPSSVSVEWYEHPLTSLTAPARRVRTETVQCRLGNRYCLGLDYWFDSHTVGRTSGIFPILKIVTPVGTRTITMSAWYYNDVGYPYPHFTDTRGGLTLIPFRIPAAGWGVCEDTWVPGACTRSSTFRDDMQRAYRNNGWYYSNEWSAHHIAQLSKGGGNAVPLNGVLLAQPLHDVFTYKWQPRFNPVNF